MDVSHLKYDPSKPLAEPLKPISEWNNTEFFLDQSSIPFQSDLKDYIAKDIYPIPQTSDREQYHDDRHGDYWLSGLKDYLLTVSRAKERGTEISANSKVFELGCATGRVLRHFAIQSEATCVGADIDSNHVAWSNTYLPNNIRVLENAIYPSLPLPSNAFDLTYVFSVFTHIEHFETAWLEEIRRITKPDGIVSITIHSDRTWREIKDTFLYQTLMKSSKRIKDINISEKVFDQPMPRERLVIHMPMKRNVNNTTVFHSIDYINKVWSRFFDIIDIIPKGHEYHDVVIMKPY